MDAFDAKPWLAPQGERVQQLKAPFLMLAWHDACNKQQRAHAAQVIFEEHEGLTRGLFRLGRGWLLFLLLRLLLRGCCLLALGFLALCLLGGLLLGGSTSLGILCCVVLKGSNILLAQSTQSISHRLGRHPTSFLADVQHAVLVTT